MRCVLLCGQFLAGSGLGLCSLLAADWLFPRKLSREARQQLEELCKKRGVAPCPQDGDDSFRVLVIDGGGTRGVIPATLQQIQRLVGQRNVFSEFDVLCGTSTGGLIVLLGCAGYGPHEIRDAYTVLAREVFQVSTWRWVCNLVRKQAQYYSSQNVLDEVARILLGERANMTLKEAFPRDKSPLIMLVSAERRSGSTPVILTNADEVGTEVGHAEVMLSNCTVLEAARATSAAPIYFETYQPKSAPEYYLEDGGVGANNPVRIAERQAKNFFGSIKCIVSLGTGDALVPDFEKNAWDRLMRHVDRIISTTTDKNKAHLEMDADPEKVGLYFRFNPQIPNYGLDDTDHLKELEQRTEHYASIRQVKSDLEKVAVMITSPTYVQPKLHDCAPVRGTYKRFNDAQSGGRGQLLLDHLRHAKEVTLIDINFGRRFLDVSRKETEIDLENLGPIVKDNFWTSFFARGGKLEVLLPYPPFQVPFYDENFQDDDKRKLLLETKFVYSCNYLIASFLEGLSKREMNAPTPSLTIRKLKKAPNYGAIFVSNGEKTDQALIFHFDEVLKPDLVSPVTIFDLNPRKELQSWLGNSAQIKTDLLETVFEKDTDFLRSKAETLSLSVDEQGKVCIQSVGERIQSDVDSAPLEILKQWPILRRPSGKEFRYHPDNSVSYSKYGSKKAPLRILMIDDDPARQIVPKTLLKILKADTSFDIIVGAETLQDDQQRRGNLHQKVNRWVFVVAELKRSHEHVFRPENGTIDPSEIACIVSLGCGSMSMETLEDEQSLNEAMKKAKLEHKFFRLAPLVPIEYEGVLLEDRQISHMRLITTDFLSRSRNRLLVEQAIMSLSSPNYVIPSVDQQAAVRGIYMQRGKLDEGIHLHLQNAKNTIQIEYYNGRRFLDSEGIKDLEPERIYDLLKTDSFWVKYFERGASNVQFLPCPFAVDNVDPTKLSFAQFSSADASRQNPEGHN